MRAFREELGDLQLRAQRGAFLDQGRLAPLPFPDRGGRLDLPALGGYLIAQLSFTIK